MRALLDKMYLASGYLAGLCILVMTLLILSQIIGRFLGVIVPSIEDFSGYSLAASTFFGLAYTFREGGHIRVTLAINNLSPKMRRIQEGSILVFAALLSVYMTFYLIHLAWESYIFEEVSYGYVPVLLWIPQVPVALGMIMLTIAIIDELISFLAGGKPSYVVHEEKEQNMELNTDNNKGEN